MMTAQNDAISVVQEQGRAMGSRIAVLEEERLQPHLRDNNVLGSPQPENALVVVPSLFDSSSRDQEIGAHQSVHEQCNPFLPSKLNKCLIQDAGCRATMKRTNHQHTHVGACCLHMKMRGIRGACH